MEQSGRDMSEKAGEIEKGERLGHSAAVARVVSARGYSEVADTPHLSLIFHTDFTNLTRGRPPAESADDGSLCQL
jgi:hypothetical protein